MMKYELLPFIFTPQPTPPQVEAGKESMRLAVSQVRYTDGLVQLDFHGSALLPLDVEARYHDLRDGLVLVVHDVGQQDGFALRLRDDFVKFPPGEGPRDPNLKAMPALPLAPRGPLQGDAYAGVTVNGGLSFQSVRPVHRPSVFLYLVLENYVSNTVGLDLLDEKVITF